MDQESTQLIDIDFSVIQSEEEQDGDRTPRSHMSLPIQKGQDSEQKLLEFNDSCHDDANESSNVGIIQPQNSPFKSENYQAFFEGAPGKSEENEHIEIKDFDNCSLIEKQSEIASFIEYDKQAEKKNETKQEGLLKIIKETKWDDVLVIMQKPSVFIVLVLFTVVMVLSLQLSGQQQQLNQMYDKIQNATDRENDLQKQLKTLNSQVSHVQSVEDDLLRKEIRLENQIEEKHNSWGEMFGEPHSIQMDPLMSHVQETENNVIAKAKKIGEGISKGFESFKHSFFDHPFKFNPPWKGGQHHQKHKFKKRHIDDEQNDDLDEVLDQIQERRNR